MSKSYEPPFTINNNIINLLVLTCENLAKLSFYLKKPILLYLKRKNMIKTIQTTLAIEGNPFNLSQVTDIINGKRVIGGEKDILEVKNAYSTYEKIKEFNGENIDDLLKAHRIMMKDIIKDNGCFRAGDVGVYSDNVLIHMAPPSRLVPEHIKNLFNWYKNSKLHSLIKSSIFHYEFEFIHPFSDGNGRIGRLWQSKLLREWNKSFYFLSIEEFVRNTQGKYYTAINESNRRSNSDVFVEYMLDTINNHVINITNSQKNDTTNDTRNDTGNDIINDTEKLVLKLLIKDETYTRKELAKILKVTLITIQRALDGLKKKGYIKRVGATKNGYYRVLKRK